MMPPICRIETPATVVHEKEHSWQDLIGWRVLGIRLAVPAVIQSFHWIF